MVGNRQAATRLCGCSRLESLFVNRYKFAFVIITITPMKTTTKQQNPFYGPLSGTTRVSQYQKKHLPAHHPDHHPIFISFFHLLRSIASSLFKLCAWQSFLHNLSPHPLWPTSWSGALHLIFHTFLHPISVFFHNTCSAHTIATCFAVVPSRDANIENA